MLVFASPDCPACLDYKPRLETEVERWQKNGAPVVFAEDEMVMAVGSIAIVLIDVTSQDQGVQQFADQYKIAALPTTILLVRGSAMPDRHEGAVDDQTIYKMLANAAR
jgi:thiol-disulfide isomerase/thioredoxin